MSTHTLDSMIITAASCSVVNQPLFYRSGLAVKRAKEAHMGLKRTTPIVVINIIAGADLIPVSKVSNLLDKINEVMRDGSALRL